MGRRTATGGLINGTPASAISGHPAIPSFLLRDDPANELFLSAGLGADRILSRLAARRNSEMTERDATEAIFQKLCEKFKLDGEQDWENAYALGGDLGHSKDEVRNALWIFATDGQHCVAIDPIRIERIRLTTLGKQRCKSVFPWYRP